MNDMANVILSVEEYKAKIDKVVKEIFVNKQILARIIKRVVPEFEDIELEAIENKYIITDDKTVSGVAVARNLTNAESLSTEDATVNEGTVYYDLMFRAKYPGEEGKMIGMYINIELQQEYHPGYKLETRAAYYAARRLSSQLPSISQNTNYGCLQKVYSIWICMGNVPEKDADTISLYRMEKHDILNTAEVERRVYDLMNVVMIRFNDNTKTQDKLVSLLQTICSKQIGKAEKLKRMEESGIRLTDQVEEGVEHMCTYGEMLLTYGKEEGKAEGKVEGKAEGKVEERTLFALRMLRKQEPLEKIREYTELSEEEILRLANENGI